MYAVIFRATLATQATIQDKNYQATAERMRQLAFTQYGCLEFSATCENQQEIAISYWPDEAAILAWKQDPEHKKAQQLGQQKWYQNYSVEVVEIKRQYKTETSASNNEQ